MAKARIETIYDWKLSTREARLAARALRKNGYLRATEKLCTATPNEIALIFEPEDTQAQREVKRLVCEAVGWQPAAS